GARLEFGELAAGWAENGDIATHSTYLTWNDYPSRSELAARYATQNGLSIDALPYYMGLAMFKIAIIMEGAYYRFATGKSTLVHHQRMEHEVPKMVQRGLRFVRGESLQAGL